MNGHSWSNKSFHCQVPSSNNRTLILKKKIVKLVSKLISRKKITTNAQPIMPNLAVLDQSIFWMGTCSSQHCAITSPEDIIIPGKMSNHCKPKNAKPIWREFEVTFHKTCLIPHIFTLNFAVFWTYLFEWFALSMEFCSRHSNSHSTLWKPIWSLWIVIKVFSLVKFI